MRRNRPTKFSRICSRPACISADILLREKKYAEARALYTKLGAETNVLISNERVRYGILLSALGSHDEAGAKTRAREHQISD